MRVLEYVGSVSETRAGRFSTKLWGIQQPAEVQRPESHQLRCRLVRRERQDNERGEQHGHNLYADHQSSSRAQA
jgi:hypothetical protein